MILTVFKIKYICASIKCILARFHPESIIRKKEYLLTCLSFVYLLILRRKLKAVFEHLYIHVKKVDTILTWNFLISKTNDKIRTHIHTHG